MSLSNKQIDILYQLRYGEGSVSLIADASKAEMASDPVLVVGLGGSGIDALLRVKSKVSETLSTGMDAATGLPKSAPDNIRFLGIDVDRGYIPDEGSNCPQRSYKGVRLETQEALSIRAADLPAFVRHAKENDVDYITDWLDPGMCVETNDLPVQRQFGRLLLFANVRKVYERLLDMMRDLKTHLEDDYSYINIFVLSGISGCIGSGIFLDVPYLIQEAAREVLGIGDDAFVWGHIRLIGYFLTPDVSLIHQTAPHIQYNGYAAMKELDYLMGLEQRHDRFQQSYGAVNVDSLNNPYSNVHLVSSYYQGGNRAEDGYDTALNAIAENVFFYVTADRLSNYGSPYILLDHTAHYMLVMIHDMEFKGRAQPVGYRYGVIGTASRVLPVEDMMTCLAFSLLDSVNDKWESCAEPSTNDVVAFVSIAFLGFDKRSLTEKLTANMSFSFESILNHPEKYPASLREQVLLQKDWRAPDFEKMLAEAKEKIDANFNDDALMNGIRDNFMTQIERFFRNTAPSLSLDPTAQDEEVRCGPLFVVNALLGAPGSAEMNVYQYCMHSSQVIEDAKHDLSDKISALRRAAEHQWTALSHTVIGRQRRYLEYMATMEALYKAFLQEYIYGYLSELYRKLSMMVLETGQWVRTITDTVSKLRDIIAHNMSLLGDPEIRRTVEGVAVRNYAVSFDEVRNTINQMVDRKGTEEPVADFYQMLWEHREGWSAQDTERYTVIPDFTSFLADEFNEVLDLGLEDFLRQDYERNAMMVPTFEEYIAHSFGNRLFDETLPLFDDRPGFRCDAGERLHGIVFIKVPRECTTIVNALRKHYNYPDNIYPSLSRNAISFIRASYGFPLYSYALIEDLEHTYEAYLAAGNPGVHLYQHGEKNWIDLPAVNPMGEWSTNYQNPREQARIERVNAIFEKAEKYGVIRYSYEDGVYEVLFAGVLDWQESINAVKNKPSALQVLIRELSLYLSPDRDFPGDKERYPGDGYAHKRIPFGRISEDAKRWFASCFDLIQQTEKEVAKYEALETALAEAETQLKQFAPYREFAQALLTGVLVKRGPRYCYVPSDNGKEAVALINNASMRHHTFPFFDLCQLLYGDDCPLTPDYLEQYQSDVATQFDAFENSDYDTVYVPAIDAFLTEVEYKLRLAENNKECLADADDIITFYQVLLDYGNYIK